MLRFSCEHCGASYRVADNAAGQTATCTKCGQKITIPQASQVGEPQPPAAAVDPFEALERAAAESRAPEHEPAPVPLDAAGDAAGADEAPHERVLETGANPPVGQPAEPVREPVGGEDDNAAPAGEPALDSAEDAAPEPPMRHHHRISPQAPGQVPPPHDELLEIGALEVAPTGLGMETGTMTPTGQDVAAPLHEVLEEMPAGDPETDVEVITSDDGKKSRAGLWIGLTVILLVVIGIGVMGVIMLQPAPPYDLGALQARYDDSQALVAEALDADSGKTDQQIIAGLDEDALVAAKKKLDTAVDKLKELQKDLDKYKKYESSDASLKELAAGVSLYMVSAEKRKSLIDETLWPRPGDISDMYERVKASVPFVKVTTMIKGHKAKATASGFLIKPPGLGYLVVTNRHVVNDAPDGYTLRFLPSGKSSRDSSDDIKVDPNAVAHISRKEDLAVIKLPAKATPVLEKLKVHPLRVAKKLKVGEPIWVVGNPGAGAEGTLIQALVKGDVSYINEENANDPTWFRLTAPINTGNSGGPVLDYDGRVVGVVSRGIIGKNEMNFAVHYHVLDEILDVMSGKIPAKDADLISLNPDEIRRVVLPEQQLTKDLVVALKPWEARGFKRLKWQGKGRDANDYMVIPPIRGGMMGMPTVRRRFTAKKGNTYSIVSVNGKTGDFDIEVYVKGGKKPIFVREANGTSKVTAAADGGKPKTKRKSRRKGVVSDDSDDGAATQPDDGDEAATQPKSDEEEKGEYRDNFVAPKDGTYEVRFVRSARRKELEGAVPQDLHVSACPVELAGVEWKPEVPQN